MKPFEEFACVAAERQAVKNTVMASHGKSIELASQHIHEQRFS
jgi:hypothetical protein